VSSSPLQCQQPTCPCRSVCPSGAPQPSTQPLHDAKRACSACPLWRALRSLHWLYTVLTVHIAQPIRNCAHLFLSLAYTCVCARACTYLCTYTQGCSADCLHMLMQSQGQPSHPLRGCVRVRRASSPAPCTHCWQRWAPGSRSPSSRPLFCCARCWYWERMRCTSTYSTWCRRSAGEFSPQ